MGIASADDYKLIFGIIMQEFFVCYARIDCQFDGN
jgi:hypothetical protein